MSATKRRKTSISLTVNQKFLNKMNQLIKTSEFSSISDIVNVSVSMFIGKLSVYENDPNFSCAKLAELYQDDNSPREKISVSYSEFLDKELEELCLVTQKNKSYVVRIALDSFLDYYSNSDKKIVLNGETNFSMTKEDLKRIVKSIMDDIKKENS
ncbi:hypothetical protein MsAg5_06740 [Methanosarcinaceae archaeon Ag5]|uniref:Uncharacterized protein n=1 Tax=Methanolapillus africanus TaxID=3028297 RepID=A0AAE4MHR3_9EURY|nr:hypothetical protein [Methanosarcinaceae archaeon Ag5]